MNETNDSNGAEWSSLFDEIPGEEGSLRRKRNFEEEESDEDWTTVRPYRKGRKVRRRDSSEATKGQLEVTISHKEKLPKSFALAKLLSSYNIKNIIRVKYLNPYKVRIKFQDEDNLNKVCQCEELIKNEWRFTKNMEVNFSYGVIRDVELDLKEEDILSNIVCPDYTELCAVKRLNRRDEEGWTPSEAVRLCFKGNILPAYIYGRHA